MSIVIKGMEMPENCSRCELHSYYASGEWRCLVNGGYLDWDSEKGRREDCPLVELPPHGRLIDADALLEWYSNDGFMNDEEWEKMHVTIGILRANIADTPTVLEAEYPDEEEARK